MRSHVSQIEVRPFVTVLTAVRDAGRARRDAGVDDPEFVQLAMRAHAVLKWFEADDEGDLDTAQQWLDAVFNGETSGG